MKKSIFLTTKSLFFAFIFLAVCALFTARWQAQANQAAQEPTAEQAGAQTESSLPFGRWRELQAQRIEGSWDVTVTPVVPPGVPQPPSFIAHATFARGGGYFGSDRTRASSKQHGVWEHLGGNRFATTFKEDLFDATGNFAGVITVRNRITLSGKDEYIGVANGEARDANGNLIFNRCTTVKATRIRLEPLSAQCQNITPPQ